MSDHGNFDESASHRTYTAPYTSRHPVPTVQGYEEHQGERQTETNEPLASERRNQDESKLQSLIDATKTNLHLNGSQSRDASIKEEPYASYNRNVDEAPNSTSAKSNEAHAEKEGYSEPMESERVEKPKELSQSAISELDPRQKRNNMKTMKRDAVGREVTDPVTHLPVTIHDFTSNELTAAPENVPPAGSNHRISTGFSAASKSEHQIKDEEEELQMEHKGLEKLFPPPGFNAAREEFARVYGLALTLTICSITVTLFMLLIGIHYANTSYVFNRNDKSISWIRTLIFAAIILMTSIGIGSGLLWGIHGWLSQKIDEIWENRVWDAAKAQEQGDTNSPIPESTRWLNSLLASIWPLINPDLFTSLADTLEDVMQASLPKLVRMISVEDLGQGSESIRVLGIRWLPTGAAAKDVSVDGKIRPSQRKEENDRKMPGQGEIDDGTKSPGQDQCEKAEDEIRSNGDEKESEAGQENIAEGMEAEEGDFVNIEVAFSYRASSGGKSLKFKSKNAHLYLAFYLPGGFRFRMFPFSSLKILQVLKLLQA